MKKLHVGFWGNFLWYLSLFLWGPLLSPLLINVAGLLVGYSIYSTITYIPSVVFLSLMLKTGTRMNSENKKTSVKIANVLIVLSLIWSVLIIVLSWVSSLVYNLNLDLYPLVRMCSAITILELFVVPIPPYIIYLVAIHSKKSESSIDEQTKIINRSGRGMIIAGWLLTIFGAIGSIISGAMYSEAKEDWEDRIYSYYSSSRSEMETAQIFLYICIGVAVLGVILLIAGYISRSSKQSAAKNEILMKQLISNQNAATVPTAVKEATAVCSKCGYHNTADAKFCNNCGEKLSSDKECHNCGFMNNVNAKFCKQCGNKF